MEQTIVITGGAGFLGRAILRRAERESWNARIIVYSRDEHHQDLAKRRYPFARYVLGDVRDEDRLGAVFAGADLVLHGAAIKHIPEAEWNVFETIDVNLAGSRTVALAAARAGVETVIGLSTDKAAAPLNTYGMTKALMERVFGEANQLGETRFACVRYGNVISSTGSALPLFMRQLEERGKVFVTDERMTRFWLSVEEAIDLIEFAAKHAAQAPGAVFVPRCGAAHVVELARLVAGEAPIEYIGLRPGEKLHETLVQEAECPRTIASSDGSMIIFPPTHTAAPSGVPIREPYSSDNPDRWIPAEEIVAIIEDAATI